MRHIIYWLAGRQTRQTRQRPACSLPELRVDVVPEVSTRLNVAERLQQYTATGGMVPHAQSGHGPP